MSSFFPFRGNTGGFVSNGIFRSSAWALLDVLVLLVGFKWGGVEGPPIFSVELSDNWDGLPTIKTSACCCGRWLKDPRSLCRLLN
mmetsp:Transcript_7316/g.20632  ORF Transcript_7316/g.20632 Transcript_7316/m.20632 type:complete len:85 (+) Transcript_7316:1517-1771(+)